MFAVCITYRPLFCHQYSYTQVGENSCKVRCLPKRHTHCIGTNAKLTSKLAAPSATTITCEDDRYYQWTIFDAVCKTSLTENGSDCSTIGWRTGLRLLSSLHLTTVYVLASFVSYSNWTADAHADQIQGLRHQWLCGSPFAAWCEKS